MFELETFNKPTIQVSRNRVPRSRVSHRN